MAANRRRSEIPSNLILKKVSPKIWLPVLTIAWGIVTMCLGFVTNYAGFMVVRAVLGITEGGLLPGIVSFQTFPASIMEINSCRSSTSPGCTHDLKWP